ncbi:UDP-forming cellulose synthase catalytic subunit [Sinimarinibacterium sp. CAU 1509]|uniref:UDP-forming cellulose synthase catalytic subunit n=1 Tax=Sinimarinibacterium sp. CAU 1509 TaxID=2562283 RepID=UPI0010AC8B6A|nr:UDP-forming cellulose synthase catalytic subunit [Sinimarinibacterium sp. CAU 1509]TJY64930.1 UDP-forming cellulose synthase catalytic subunit [Sinimarinibacterium sp. CAU 1509]
MPEADAKTSRGMLSQRLGVSDPHRLSQWLWRLFVLPAEQRRPLPLLLELIWLRLRVVLIRELGVRKPDSPRDWIAACLLLRPASPDAPTEAWHAPLIELLQPLWFVLKLMWWPMQRLSARLDRVDYGPADRRLESFARLTTERYPLIGYLMVISVTLLLAVCATTPLSPGAQFALLILMWGTTLLLRRLPGKVPTLIMVGFSLVASSRYIWWRLTETLDLQPGAEMVMGIGLVLAECYTWLVLILRYVQDAWALKRPVAPLPPTPQTWPSVDVFITTYDEALSVIKPTVLAALSLDWPKDKLNVCILDDGRREELRRFAESVGAQYIIRSNNFHAKAGNLNHALSMTRGDLVAVFDCDHIPVRSFLQTTVGWFLRDPKCALVQTPHHFFSPDPFERNLGTFGRVPNESALFYGVIQDGNDLWNATFFCGSCAVLKRSALEHIGGFAVETLTEDAHTALRLHRHGYTSAYVRLTQAAGLATETLPSHIKQRMRWARGMAQMFRIDNPLFGRGLTLLQRICYANSMIHFFNGLPRLVFLSAPLGYLFFEYHIINAWATTIAVYVLPHLIQAELVGSRIQGHYRHSFWAEAYESVLAWYIAVPAMMALINPRAGRFNITAKGGLIEHGYFDWKISIPYIVLTVLNSAGFIVGVGRLLFWNTHEIGTVLMNLAWTAYNILMLGAALGVAAESRQVRVAHRVPLRIPATLYFDDGRAVVCTTSDYSTRGLGISLDAPLAASIEAPVKIALSRGDREFVFQTTITSLTDTRAGLRFERLSLDDERHLIECTFARADAWLDAGADTPQDRPLASLGEIIRFGALGYGHLLSSAFALLSTRLYRLRRRTPLTATA